MRRKRGDSNLLKYVWHGLLARVFTGKMPLPHQEDGLFQQAAKVSDFLANVSSSYMRSPSRVFLAAFQGFAAGRG